MFVSGEDSLIRQEAKIPHQWQRSCTLGEITSRVKSYRTAKLVEVYTRASGRRQEDE